MYIKCFVYFFPLALTLNILVTSGRLVNKEVQRSIDISTQLVVIRYNITLKNNGQGMTNKFDFFVEPKVRNSLAYLEASTTDYSSMKVNLKVIKIEENEFYGEASWQINFKKPVKAGQLIKLEIVAVFTHQLFPYPAYIYQNDNQLINYSGNYYFYSPYFTEKQSTVIVCSSDTFESYTILEPTSQFKNFITYGPYENVPPFSIQKQTVHYVNNEPFLTITNMERVIEVSHWGNIAVEENIELVHCGAVLKGSFSRFGFQESQKGLSTGLSSVSAFTTILPASAKDIYYKDVIGNISSSHLRILEDSIELHVKFRFPLFGGWKISYTIGYNVPSYEYLYSNGEDYALRMRVLDHVFDNMVVDELITKVILPEYCTDVWLFTPFPMIHLPDATHYSYLDIVGRPVVIIAKDNMVEHHIQNFELHYVFTSNMMFVEPLVITLVLYCLLILVAIVIRLDFSITSDDSIETHVKGSSTVQQKPYKNRL